MNKILFVIGPGGVGKSTIDHILNSKVIRIDPIRFRNNGPRNKFDKYYAHPTFGNNLISLLGEKKNPSLTRYYYSEERVLEMIINNERQIVFFPKELEHDGVLIKIEIHCSQIGYLINKLKLAELLNANVEIILLNPSQYSFVNKKSFVEVKNRTEDNCKQRGDSEGEILLRVNAVENEINEWKNIYTSLNNDIRFIEYIDWQFSEWKFNNLLHDNSVGNSNVLLEDLKSTFIIKQPWLIDHFK